MEGPDETTRKIEDLSSVVASLATAAQAEQQQIKALAVTARAQQARLESVDPEWQETGERIKRLIPEAAALVLNSQAFDAKWQALMDRFDAWLRGQGGNGRPS